MAGGQGSRACQSTSALIVPKTQGNINIGESAKRKAKILMKRKRAARHSNKLLSLHIWHPNIFMLVSIVWASIQAWKKLKEKKK